MPQKNFSKSERALVKEAAINSTAREHLKQELLPYVAQATRQFMQSRGIAQSRENELVEVGMKPFDQVFNIYLKNSSDRDAEEGHFYKYYIWWMRQAIVDFLQMNP
jgi:hypothetical protein